MTGTDDPARVAQELADPEKEAELSRRPAAIRLEHDRIEAADHASAREQTVSLARLGLLLAWGPTVVSAFILVLFAVVIVSEPRGALLGEGSKKLLEYLLVGVCACWLGSSRGSAEKTELLKR